MMDERNKEEIKSKIDRYEALARQFSDSATGDKIRKEIESLRRQLRALDG